MRLLGQWTRLNGVVLRQAQALLYLYILRFGVTWNRKFLKSFLYCCRISDTFPHTWSSVDGW